MHLHNCHRLCNLVPHLALWLPFGWSHQQLSNLQNAMHLSCVDNKSWTACGDLQAGGSWLGKVTAGWQAGRISNLDYLLYCNLAAGRSFNDLTQVCAPELTHIPPKLGLCAWLSASIS